MFGDHTTCPACGDALTDEEIEYGRCASCACEFCPACLALAPKDAPCPSCGHTTTDDSDDEEQEEG